MKITITNIKEGYYQVEEKNTGTIVGKTKSVTKAKKIIEGRLKKDFKEKRFNLAFYPTPYPTYIVYKIVAKGTIK